MVFSVGMEKHSAYVQRNLPTTGALLFSTQKRTNQQGKRHSNVQLGISQATCALPFRVLHHSQAIHFNCSRASYALWVALGFSKVLD